MRLQNYIRLENYTQYSPAVLRIGISFVFLWFGLNQLLAPDNWLGYIPNFTLNFGFDPVFLIYFNGAFETVLGTLLVIGVFTRIVSFLLFTHLLGIAFSLGYNDVMIRDLGLSIATFSVFLHGPDKWCRNSKK